MREKVFVQECEPSRQALLSANSASLYRRAGKQCIDVVFAAAGIALSSPVLFACACAVKFDSPGPVFFRQQRVGQRGRLFTLLKFRSMRVGPEGDQLKITVAGDSRVTPVGRWLRKTKLDELPQLFNVLVGDMSLIGPRPEVPEYVRYYDSTQRAVLQLKPGITGPSSLEFIDEEELLKGESDPHHFYCTQLLPRKVAIDLKYCESANLVSDCSIACRTLCRVLAVRRLFSLY
jgi:lipopolysaccharide/colanic/teichoic acid biosynthesis glycosyltransferase